MTDIEIVKEKILPCIKNTEWGKALDRVIKALEQEPCGDCRNCKKWNECPCGKEGHENGTSIGYSIGECKDYEKEENMSREKAIAMLKSKLDGHTDTSYEWCECVRMAIKAVEQKPKTGHWIGIDEEPHEDYECDKCGYVVSTYTANIEPHTEYKFCPNCGARMSEVSE